MSRPAWKGRAGQPRDSASYSLDQRTDSRRLTEPLPAVGVHLKQIPYEGGVPCDTHVTNHSTTSSAFETMGKRRRGFPSETQVKRVAVEAAFIILLGRSFPPEASHVAYGDTYNAIQHQAP